MDALFLLEHSHRVSLSDIEVYLSNKRSLIIMLNYFSNFLPFGADRPTAQVKERRTVLWFCGSERHLHSALNTVRCSRQPTRLARVVESYMAH